MSKDEIIKTIRKAGKVLVKEGETKYARELMLNSVIRYAGTRISNGDLYFVYTAGSNLND